MPASDEASREAAPPEAAPPEAWMRGPIAGLDPVVSHLVRAAQQIRADLRAALIDLTGSEVQARPHSQTPAGFHARHLAGSTARLCAYLAGRGLTEEELAAIPREGIGPEGNGTDDAAELADRVDAAFNAYEALIRSLHPEDYAAIRHVGRARLPVNAISLAIHIAEHGQRHVGQAIAAAKLVRALRHG